MNSSESKAKKMYSLVASNPNSIFNLRKICQMYNFRYKNTIEPLKATTILSRLFNKDKILRTNNQLSKGYLYSLSNKEGLDFLYDYYLLPYYFDNRKEVINAIIKNKFEKLRVSVQFNTSLPKNSDFIEKYGLSYILREDVSAFIAMNIGFLLCDGPLKKDLQQVCYFFNQKEDAELFKNDFLSIFNKEKLSLAYRAYCYTVGICNKNLATLFNSLGVPTGNKVYRPFLIPNWIYNGPTNIKRIFLSTIYGNEGSKPQDNKWRIQFVLSKTKKYVPNLIQFLNQIRTMLGHFGISTSHIQLRKQKRRTFCGRFYIKGKENLIKFYDEIGFLYASEKQEVLESLILKGKS